MGYAPDILQLVDDGSLKDIGIKPGDVIRLKQHSLQWLNSSASKRKQDDHTPLGASIPPNKRVRFEKRYHDGGSSRVYGPRIVRPGYLSQSDLFLFLSTKLTRRGDRATFLIYKLHTMDCATYAGRMTRLPIVRIMHK